MPVVTSARSLAPQRTALLWLVATVTLVLGQDSDVHTCQADLSWVRRFVCHASPNALIPDCILASQ